MAVKAQNTITLYSAVSIKETKLYFKLVNAGSSAPSKPTTLTPSGWTTTEPTFDISKDLYATTETIFSDDSFLYSNVTKYSSYEAAKQAYNTATNAQNTVNSYIEENELIIGTQTEVTGSWTGVAKFNTLTDGQEIVYWLPYNGSGNATLNLTLANGTTTGAKNCYYSGTNRLTTHYGAGNIIRMVYRENVSIAGSTTLYTGWWCDANYDSNNTDRLRFQNTIKFDEQYIPAGRIIAAGTNDLYSVIRRDSQIKVDGPILCAQSSMNPLSTGNNNYLMYSGITFSNNLNMNCDIGTESFTNSTKGYSGTAITGTSTTGTVFSGSGISSAVVGDLYINTSSYYLYKCTTAGNASTAKWAYVKSLATAGNKRWWTGTTITGTNTTPTVFSNSGISSASQGAYYFNTSTGYYYECTLGGNASTAKWKYCGVLTQIYKTLYMRGTITGDIFTVDAIPFTTTVPTEDDGLYYISLGTMYAVNSYGLFTEHPMYKYVDGEFKSLSKLAYDDSIKINGKIESYYQSTDPSSSWSTNVEKETHIGDIWYNTSNQKTFVYYKNNTNPVTYEWKWQNVPIELIDSVNGKATIYSGVIPTNYKTGDYWIIPTNCYTNSYSIPSTSSQVGNYDVGMELVLGPYTLVVDAVNSSNKITSYHVNVPATGNYNIGGTYTDGNLILTVTSTSNFTLPTNCYGGSICVATANGTTYNSSNWIPRNDYVPADMAGRYSLAEDVNDYINNLQGEINNVNSNLSNTIGANYTNLTNSINNNYTSLDNKINNNVTNLNDAINDTNDYISDVDAKYDDIINNSNTGIRAAISKLEDRLVANIRGTGGNNLLQNSVGFRQQTYWHLVSSSIIEQEYKTYPGQLVTISFRYKKTNSSDNAQVLLGKYTGSTFTTLATILNVSSSTTDWIDVSYSYESSINNPVIRFNSAFTGVQDNDAEANGASGSKLVFNNSLIITDLMIGYGEKQPWTPYYNEVYGKTYNLDAYGFDIREAASNKYSHLDSNGLDFYDGNTVESEFSKSRTATDNIFIANSINIGNLKIIKLDDNNIIEY